MYHYTNAGALMGILSDNELWLTHFRYMNDNQEIIYYFDKIKHKILKEICERALEKEMFEALNEQDKKDILKKYLESGKSKLSLDRSINEFGIYIGSFCKTSNDLLSQWRGYTNRTVGYCIEFDEDSFKKSIKSPYAFHIDNCMYDEQKINQLLLDSETKYIKGDKESLEKWLSNSLGICALSKHHGFKEENEKRLLIITDGEPQPTPFFRVNEGTLVPYMKIGFTKDVVKSIKIGPTNKSQLCKESLDVFLKANGYEHVITSCSDTPLRN